MFTAAARLAQAGGLLLQIHARGGRRIWVFPSVALASVNCLENANYSHLMKQPVQLFIDVKGKRSN